MTDVRAWLTARQPTPPAEMAEWMELVADGTQSLYRVLAEGGLEALDRAREAPGRVRDSAFHLLAADALLTYACEAALEVPDPGTALVEILEKAVADRP